jgi:hypothetical protein
MIVFTTHLFNEDYIKSNNRYEFISFLRKILTTMEIIAADNIIKYKYLSKQMLSQIVIWQ